MKKCAVCGSEFLRLSAHMKMHDLTMEEYLTQYPNGNDDIVVGDSETGEITDQDSSGVEVDDNLDGDSESDKAEDTSTEPTKEVEPDKDEVIVIDSDISSTKADIHNLLKETYPDIEMDVNIIINSPSGINIVNEVVDFAIVSEKRYIDFPDKHWHNKDIYPDAIKDQRLQKNGWTKLKSE